MRKQQPVTRKIRALRNIKAAQGDVAKLAVAYDWFRAELADFVASGGDTGPAAALMTHIWKTAETVSEINEEAAVHGAVRLR